MDIETVTGIAREALVLSIQVVLPVLAAGLLVGLLVSVLQAVTQVQEQTLSFIPKVLAMLGVLLVLLPWFLSLLSSYMEKSFSSLNDVY